MASSVMVPITVLKNVRKHPNADKLELADVLGYQMAIPKGLYKDGDRVVYFPADTLIPTDWAEKFKVKDFLKGKNKDRVGKIKLRGEPSFGLVVPIPQDCNNWNDGDNVAEYFNVKKYEPPINPNAGDAAEYEEAIDPLFDKYTDIENGRIFTDVFINGEEVVVTEKIHGTNCRIGIVDGIDVAGSMGLRRTKPETEEGIRINTYWHPWSLPNVANLIRNLGKKNKVVQVFGEIYGGSIQSLNYGIPKREGIGFKVFDIKINGKYLNWDDLERYCSSYEVEMVPVLYKGAFSYEKIHELSSGNTTLIENGHIREGVVVKPVKERNHDKIGRVILKYIGIEYSLTNKTDFKDL